MALKAQILSVWDRLRSSFWFLPSLMAGGTLVLAFVTVAVDEAVADKWMREQRWAYTGGAEGASAVLGTIAGSMITVAGLVFSLTLVALTLASSQFGPRMLRNFMRDTTNQIVLGTFISTFLYCLLVLRTIRREGEGAFVPHLSVTLGVAFAMASLWVLIYFIHHVSMSIHADEIVARVAAELTESIDRLFPQRIGQALARPTTERAETTSAESSRAQTKLPEDEDLDRAALQIRAHHDGYLQLIDADALMSLAVCNDVLVRIDRRPGHYIVADGPLATVSPSNRVDDDCAAAIRAAFVVGRQRTPVQDLEFSVLQLVEIAVRALSPGVNDPFTAMTCVDRLASALCRLAGRDIPSPLRVDERGRLRVIAPATTFSAVVDAAFNQVRQNARTSAAVSIRLLEAIATIAASVTRPDDRTALRRHAEMVARGAREGLPEENDRADVEQRYRAACELLDET